MHTVTRRCAITGVLLAALIGFAHPHGAGPGVPWRGQAARAQSITFPVVGGHAKPEGRVDVEAAPEQVWAVLTDFSAYPIWNPFIYPVKGDPRPGSTLEITLHSASGSATYPATVVTAEPNHELSWTGKVFGSGLFDVTFTFTIEPRQDGRTRLAARETRTGLAPAVGWLMQSDVPQGLDEMVKALRNRAELLRVMPHPVPEAAPRP